MAGIGLAWVKASSAKQDETIDVRVNGGSLKAKITMAPFYDPEGTRLRE